jgi:hypothetical protein
MRPNTGSTGRFACGVAPVSHTVSRPADILATGR